MRLLALVFFLIAVRAPAQEGVSKAEFDPASAEPVLLAPIRVFGGDSRELDRAVAPKKVGREKLETYQYTDVSRALKQTTGVYVREEDAQGLRPNIGLRGTNPDRSKKVVLLEDGVLIGPAPYAAPAAYYTPSMNHVESLEISKGFAAVGIGPNSVGGAVNYVSTPIPTAPEVSVQSMAGSYSTVNSKLTAGAPTSFGAYLVQASRLTSDGFKRLDAGTDGGRDAAGFTREGVLGKLRFDLPGSSSSRAHHLEFRLGHENERSDETYLGLTQSDFDADPFRRYATSSLDQMRWTHQKIQLAHTLQFGDASVLETTAYRHRFQRAWYRLDKFRGGTGLNDVLKNPEENPILFGILRGDSNSSDLGPGAQNAQLLMANNDRSYLSEGVQTKLASSWAMAGFSLEPELFLRVHTDRIDRDHGADFYGMENRVMVSSGDPRQQTALESETAEAVTMAALVPISAGAWTVTPVLRAESVRFVKEDLLNPAKNNTRGDSAVIPGVAVLRKFGDKVSARASVNRGATLAGLSSTGNEVKELATNYEAELKLRDPEASLEADVTAFFSDYSNLTESCTISSGCDSTLTDTAFNGGRARISGVEAGVAKGYSLGAVFVPVQLQFTLMRAVFNSSFESDSPTWGRGAIEVGDPLPYIPETQAALTVGAERGPWKQELTWTQQSRMFDQSAAQGRAVIEGHGVLDWAGHYQLTKSARLMAKIDNALGSQYVVAARPYGLRPGKPQTLSAGLLVRF